MTRSLISAALASVALAAPALAADGTAAPLKVLRTLVYAVTFTEKNTAEEKTSGFLGGDAGAITAGSATVKRNANVDDSGTLTVNVLAATQDGALAVDAAFAGKATSQPTVRIVISPDGRLGYDPNKPIAPETARILPLLARGLVANRDVSPGSSWTIDAPAPARGTTTYRVSALRDELATLGIDGDLIVPGPQGFQEHDRGTVTYATDRLCPITYDLTARSHHQASTEQYVSTNAHLTATLVSDSFAKK